MTAHPPSTPGALDEDGLEPRRVLFLIPTLEYGGAERVFATYVNRARAIAPSVLLHRGLIAPPHHPSPGIPLSFLLPAEPRSKRDRFWSRWERFPLLARIREAWLIRKAAGRQRCPVVSSFLLKSTRVAVFAKIFFAPRLRVAANVHELMSQHLRHAHPFPPSRRLHEALARFALRRADLVIAVAEGVKTDLVERFAVPAEKIRVVYNPVDVGGVRRSGEEPWGDESYGPPGHRLLVSVGRLVELKGLDYLVDAVASISPRCPVTLIIVGEGTERPALEERIRTGGLEDRVFLIGARENPWKYMARADLFILPSLTEAFPNVIGEAFALGKPVIAADCSPGVREYLRDGACGLLVPPANARALAEGIELLLEDPALGRRFVENAGNWLPMLEIEGSVRRYEEALATLWKG
ncbi:MAG: glycosyltransferase [Candidatus Eisenbacteria bacterium]